VLVELNAAATRIHKEGDPEKVALKEAVADLRQFMTDQSLGHYIYYEPTD